MNQAKQTSEHFFAFNPIKGETMAEMFERLAWNLGKRGAVIVNLIIFGSISAYPKGLEAMRRVFGKIEWPVTWVQGDKSNFLPVVGLQVFAFAGGPISTINFQGRVLGCSYENSETRNCFLGSLAPRRSSKGRSDQAGEMFKSASTALHRAGFSLSDVVRTWFFLDEILSWYDDFNRVRTRVYSAMNFRHNAPPASTGVGGICATGRCLTGVMWAVQSKYSTNSVKSVLSPLQCAATTYGSMFSRAVQISEFNGEKLTVSGTASIAASGQTMWPGNVFKQIERSMEVVQGILRSREFRFENIIRLVAYFKCASGMSEFKKWCVKHCLAHLPIQCVCTDLCRSDLLFEIELDAWKGKVISQRAVRTLAHSYSPSYHYAIESEDRNIHRARR
jgi:enamine deaminase RidA (YjgF/YER057c/UK114 family)